MNGRCETDPLDLAVDVCDRCYGEFCDNHLVRPKGRRHPFCSDCALAASGVRGSNKLELRGNRRTAKKRRAELKAQPEGDEQVFTFFELEEGEEATESDQDAVVAEAETELKTFDEPAEGEADEQALADDELPPTPAVAKLEELRRGTEPEAPGQEEVDAASQPAPAPEPVAEAATPPSPATDEPSGTEKPTAPPPPQRPPKPAAPRLQTQTPAPVVETPAVSTERPEPEPQRQAAPRPAAASSRPAEAKPTSDDQAGPSEHSAQQQPEDRAPGSLPLPSRHSRLPADSQPVPNRVESGDAQDGGDDELTGAAAPPPTHRRPTAPMIGEVRNVAGRRAEDAPVPLAEAPTPVPATNLAANDTRNAIEEFDATRPADNVNANPSGSADTDGNGNWIPPILRGFAPDAAEAKADLPKRRNTD